MVISASLKEPGGHGKSEEASGSVFGGPCWLLRLEGLGMLVLACALYERMGADWLRFALLFLAPDLSLLGYFLGATRGAAIYNALHSEIGPIVLAALGLFSGVLSVMPYALIWFAHVGFDRALGYGLKYRKGFQSTHLGWIGRVARSKSVPLVRNLP